MPSMAEMVEAHLMNVQREISSLEERKVAIDSEIEKQKSYLVDGSETLKESNATIQPKSDVQSSTVFNPSLGGS